MTTDAAIARYYDRLTRWNSVARAIGYGGGRHALTVHRALADPFASGRVTPSRLYDLLFDHLPPLDQPCVLDAGCGMGGTMIEFVHRIGGRYTGLTLSPSQASIAGRAVERAGLGKYIDVLLRSYDDPPAGPFDLVLAIESLAHSVNPGVSLESLVRVLARGGVVAIADDMPEADANASSDLGAFKSGWHCPVLWSREEYVKKLTDLGLDVRVDLDLTEACRPRSAVRIRALETLNRYATVVPSAGLRAVLASHRGGLALERLLRARLVRYRLLIAQR